MYKKQYELNKCLSNMKFKSLKINQEINNFKGFNIKKHIHF